MKNKKRSLRMEIKAISDEGSFDGVLATYNTVDLGGDLIEPGAFTKTMQEHGPEVKLLWQHEPSNVIGRLQLVDGPDALRVKGQIELDDDIPYSITAYKLLKKNLLSGLSIGYDTIKDQVENGVRRLKELRLWEGSIVTFPMNELANVTSVKRAAPREAKDDFNTELAETQLQDAGYQMREAIMESLSEILFDPDLSRDDKLSGSALALQQFTDAYLGWLPQYLDYLDAMAAGMDGGGMQFMHDLAREEKFMRGRVEWKAFRALEMKEGRRFSSATMKSLSDAHGHVKSLDTIFTALLEAVDDSEEDDDTSSAKAAVREPEPVEDHSAAKILVRIRSLIPKT
jgi:Escherichia/Staphylococcus phage prohead protease